MASDRNIPLPIQREVRRRCGFGCVICGFPLYEYHHMRLFSEVLEHKADNLTLLCDNHHKQVTNGLITDEQIRTANKTPFNIVHEVSAPFGLNFSGSECHVVIGNNHFLGTLKDGAEYLVVIPVSIDDIDLLCFLVDSSGRIFLNANIFDENNLPVLLIHENRIVYRTNVWDIDFSGRTLTLRETLGQFLIEISFEPPNTVNIRRARLLCNGIEVIVRKSYIYVVNTGQFFSNVTFSDFVVGLQLGRNARGLPPVLGSTSVSRYLLPRDEVEKREREGRKIIGI